MRAGRPWPSSTAPTPSAEGPGGDSCCCRGCERLTTASLEVDRVRVEEDHIQGAAAMLPSLRSRGRVAIRRPRGRCLERTGGTAPSRRSPARRQTPTCGFSAAQPWRSRPLSKAARDHRRPDPQRLLHLGFSAALGGQHGVAFCGISQGEEQTSSRPLSWRRSRSASRGAKLRATAHASGTLSRTRYPTRSIGITVR